MLSGAVPRYRCASCGEYLPHYCAAEIVYLREPYRLRGRIVIADRYPSVQITPASPGN